MRDARLEESLLGLLNRKIDEVKAIWLLGTVSELAESNEDKSQTRDILLQIIQENPFGNTSEMVRGLVMLSTTAGDKSQTRDALLWLLDDCRFGRHESLTYGVASLAETIEDKDMARRALLHQLTGPILDGWPAVDTVKRMLELDPEAEDKHFARNALFQALIRPLGDTSVGGLMTAMLLLEPKPED